MSKCVLRKYFVVLNSSDCSISKRLSIFSSVAVKSRVADRLKQLAKRQNRSLNNYVETLLLDAAYHEPNETTLAAMEEVRSGKLRDTQALDLSSIESMEKSMGL